MAVLDTSATTQIGTIITTPPMADPFAIVLAFQVRQGRMLANLAHVAEPRSAPGVSDLAGRILDYLMLELPGHLDDEEAILIALESQPDVPAGLDAVADALREEHGAIHKLLPPVMRGLRYLSVGRMPTAPKVFSGACAILLEFMRLHAAYVQGTLLPLARQLTGPDALSSLALDMACRREATGSRRLEVTGSRRRDATAGDGPALSGPP